MNLKEFLFRKEMKINDFAASIGYSRAIISRVIHGKMPGKHLAQAIEKATEEKVKFKLEKKKANKPQTKNIGEKKRRI